MCFKWRSGDLASMNISNDEESEYPILKLTLPQSGSSPNLIDKFRKFYENVNHIQTCDNGDVIYYLKFYFQSNFIILYNNIVKNTQ